MPRVLLTAVLVLGLGACATLPNGKPTPGDPLERFNRSVWVFDNAFDHAILRPVASGYVHYTPPPVRNSLYNFFTNLVYSDTIVNDFLQGKFKDSGMDLARLTVNTVLGLGGLFDPASRLTLDRHDTDLGVTLGVWGLHEGPFVMLPFLGPSDVRDGLALAGDAYMEPYPYIPNQYVAYGLYVGDKLDERAQLLGEDKLIDSAYDPYSFVRDAYLQERTFKVHGSQTQTPEQLFPGLINDAGSGSNTNPGPTLAAPPPTLVPPR